MTTSAGRWAAVTASVRGASHERDGKPNQDAVRVVATRGPAAGLVAAVCDGHGGGRYVRSDVGSRFGVEVACEIGKRALGQLGPSALSHDVVAHLTGPVAESIVARWRERVLDDVRRRPFTDDEERRAGAPLDGDPLVSYGCTLVLAVLAPSWVGLLQIGDGDVTVVRGARGESPVPDDDRLVGGETTSLCLPTAVADARVRVLTDPLPDAIMLTSDGYANSFASPTWRTDAGTDLCDHVARTGLDRVEARLPEWLADSATAGGDDVSMAFIQRLDARRRPARPETVPLPAAVVPATSSPLRRRGAVAGVAAVAAIAGVALGWGLSRTSNAAEPAASSTMPVVTTTSTSVAVTTTSVLPTTIVPTTVPSEPATIELGNAHEPMLLVGGDTGLLLTYDPQGRTAPRFITWMATPFRTIGLPAGWTFTDGVLEHELGTCVAATVIGDAGDLLWAVGPDGATLTSFDALNGSREDHQIDEGRPVPSGATPAATCDGDDTDVDERSDETEPSDDSGQSPQD